MQIKIEDARIYVTVPGHSWVTGSKAPEIEDWEPFWVSHYGSERTVYTYRPKDSSTTAPVTEVIEVERVVIEPQSIAARHEEIYGEDDDDRAYERSLDA